MNTFQQLPFSDWLLHYVFCVITPPQYKLGSWGPRQPAGTVTGTKLFSQNSQQAWQQVSSWLPRQECPYGPIYIRENFHPGYRDPVAKTAIMVTRPARLLTWTHQHFYQRKEWRGEISETEPARLTRLIWRNPEMIPKKWRRPSNNDFDSNYFFGYKLILNLVRSKLTVKSWSFARAHL